MSNDDYPQIPKLERFRYTPFGRCIYCASASDLRIEHIIPYGLGGTLELPASTCKSCADVTSRIERVVLRGELWAVRVYRDVQSRRGHKDAPKNYPLEVEKDGTRRTIELPASDYPILLHFPTFSAPRVLTTAEKRPGIDVTGIITLSFGPHPEAVLRKLGGDALCTTQTQHPAEFARMIAKIAYSMAAATGALELINEPSPICGVILGTDLAIGHYVGTLDYPLQKHEDQLHRVVVIPDYQRGLLIGDVQLFSDSPAPRYGVVLGSLRTEGQTNNASRSFFVARLILGR